jgi:N-acetylglucosamine-6-phosphate deacetylase
MGLIADGVHSHPAMLQLAWKLVGASGICLVTDAMAAQGMPPGTYRLGDFDVYVDETSARLQDGTLAGSILTQEQALRNLMHWCGASLLEVLPALTSTPARPRPARQRPAGPRRRRRPGPGYRAGRCENRDRGWEGN